MTKRFTGRRALVTGASRGIGVGIAERLAAEGADVVIVGRTLEPGASAQPGSLREVADRLAGYGTTVVPLAVDLTDEESRADLIDRAAGALGGPIDTLVNNAAAAIYAPMADFPLRRRRVIFEANVHAPLDLAQQVLSGMRERGAGWIVNLTSGTAKQWPGPPFELTARGTEMTIYGASKAALNRLTNGLGAELHGTGIRVNAVTPRFGVATEGAVSLIGDDYRDAMETMEQMVEATVALCDCDEDVTGQVLVSLDLLQEWNLDVRQLDGSVL
ncbi:MAG: SDR family NAD(P)-dependent oxidoreductase [Propionibacterium sp.]|nr:SDR family NAD(P)-dependent oxidoreductase [Propionibacterium sp.]